MIPKQAVDRYVSSPRDLKRLRIMSLKTKLPNPWMADFVEQFPKYDSLKQGNRVKAVLELRMLTEEIIIDLETFVNTKK